MKKYITKKIKMLFGDNIGLEHLVFLCVAYSGICVAFAGFLGNLSLGFHIVVLIVPLSNIAIDVICIIYSRKTKRWKGPATIVVCYAVFILLPTLWFFTGGTKGSTLSFIPMSALYIVIIFEGRLRITLLVADITMYTTFVMLELGNPNIFVAYPNRQVEYIDISIGLFLSFVVTASLAYVVLSRYKRAKTEEEALVEKLRTLSITDQLTQLYNRRFLTADLDEEMRKAYKYGNPLVIAIFDVDFFKRVNDAYGHNYGDTVLIKLSETMMATMDENDIVGRYGGEEFLMIFRQNMDEVKVKIERMYEAISKIPWEHGSPITISGGVSSYIKGITMSDFVANADEKLYKAKSSGRNCVIYTL